MSTKEQINTILDGYSEAQLINVLSMLQSMQRIAEEEADEAYCQKLYEEYMQNPEPVSEMTSLEDFAKELGIELS